MAGVRMAGRPGICKTPHVCGACGVTFYPKRASTTKFCGRGCGLAFSGMQSTLRNGGGRVVHRVLRLKCAECGGRFAASRSDRKYCSPTCSVRAAGKRSIGWMCGMATECRECGSPFVAEYGDKRRAFCSERCSARNVRRKVRKLERARMRGAKAEAVDPIAVFDRDGWRCRECRAKTPRHLRGTIDQRAPELDHILPLSKGGEHSYRNTQCLCRACNAAKSDTARGQLVLI